MTKEVWTTFSIIVVRTRWWNPCLSGEIGQLGHRTRRTAHATPSSPLAAPPLFLRYRSCTGDITDEDLHRARRDTRCGSTKRAIGLVAPAVHSSMTVMAGCFRKMTEAAAVTELGAMQTELVLQRLQIHRLVTGAVATANIEWSPPPPPSTHHRLRRSPGGSVCQGRPIPHVNDWPRVGPGMRNPQIPID